MTDITFSSEIKAELVDSMASDLRVVQAARVSTAGERANDKTELTERDKGLIKYLLRERHMSPTEHNYFTFFVKAPIFVMRELMRHRIASYNEESGRYRELKPEFYRPGNDRKLVQIGKPGHYEFIDGTQKQHAMTEDAYLHACGMAYDTYQDMLQSGIAREVARGVLPVTLFSSCYVTINARSLMNVISLRRNVPESTYPSYPQREIEFVAEDMEKAFAEKMPITHAAFVEFGRVAL